MNKKIKITLVVVVLLLLIGSALGLNELTTSDILKIDAYKSLNLTQERLKILDNTIMKQVTNLRLSLDISDICTTCDSKIVNVTNKDLIFMKFDEKGKTITQVQNVKNVIPIKQIIQAVPMEEPILDIPIEQTLNDTTLAE